MQNNKLIIFVGALAIAAAATMLVEKKGSTPADQKTGTHLLNLKEDGIASVRALTITKAEQSLILKLSDEANWNIASDGQFPANASKILRFLEDLSEAKIVRTIASSKQDWADYDLESPSAIYLESGSESVPKRSIYVGKNRSGGGQYVRLDELDSIYLVDKLPQLETDPTNWSYRSLIQVEAKKIKAITFENAQGKSEFDRAKPEDPYQLKDLNAEKEKLKEQELRHLDSLISDLQFSKRSKITPEFQKALETSKDQHVHFEAFEGQSYDVSVVKLTTQVAAPAPDDAANAKTKDTHKDPKMEEKHSYYLHITSTDPALARLNDLMKEWQFEVSEYVANNFRKSRNDFVESLKS